MRKQTKLVAVLSAAALLAMGASMTSFAAGWEKDDAGIWHYYDSDDELVTGEWKKDGGKWFYLDDEGDMLTDAWVDDDYYVGEDGAMLVNEWKKTYADEDIDDPDEDGESWYYFGSKGKKVAGDSKKINGRTYYFDTDGKMLDGWYDDNGDVYYLGGEDEGWRTQGWMWLEKPADEDNTTCDDNCTICDEEGWYYFGSNGKMYKGEKKKKVNGRFYYFNEHGQMLYEWVNGTRINSNPASNGQLDGNAAANSASISNMIYTNVVEEGWRADGWYEIDGSKSVGTADDTNWYYFKNGEAKAANFTTDCVMDGNGNNASVIRDNDGNAIMRAKIKVNGKYFCFNEKGQMQTGLQYIPASNGFFFFDENGYMKTGRVSSVDEDNDAFTYYFITKNGNNGRGFDGVKDNYLYFFGKRLEADDDYKLYAHNGNVYLVNNKGKVQKSASKKYDIEGIGADQVVTFDGNKVTAVGDTTVSVNSNFVTKPSIELYDHEFEYNNSNVAEWN